MDYRELVENIEPKDRIAEIHSQLCLLIDAIEKNRDRDVIEGLSDRLSLYLCIEDFHGVEIKEYSSIYTALVQEYRLAHID